MPGQDQADKLAAWRAELARQARAQRARRGRRPKGLATVHGAGMIRVSPPPPPGAQP